MLKSAVGSSMNRGFPPVFYLTLLDYSTRENSRGSIAHFLRYLEYRAVTVYTIAENV